MFGIPLEEIDYSTITRFLETGVREGFSLDFKRDFPSNLEKTISAFANTYGGIVLIGVDEAKAGAAQLPVNGIELKPGLRERVIQIGLDAIYPPVVPEVRVVELGVGSLKPERAVVVVRVHESDNAPHAVDSRTTVYLRADNVSDRLERKATLGDLEWLVNKRQKSLEEKSRIVECAIVRGREVRPRRRARRAQEHYRAEGGIRIYTVPTFPRAPLLDTRSLLDAVQHCKVQIPAVPHTLPDGRQQRIAEGVMFDGGYGYSEFQQQGLICHELDYFWDYLQPGVSGGARQLLPGVTAALLWGSLELSRKVYRAVGYSGLVDFRFEADGLKDAFFGDQRRMDFYEIFKLVESRVTVERRFSVGELELDVYRVARNCQRDLYWAFGVNAGDKLLDFDFNGCE